MTLPQHKSLVFAAFRLKTQTQETPLPAVPVYLGAFLSSQSSLNIPKWPARKSPSFLVVRLDPISQVPG